MSCDRPFGSDDLLAEGRALGRPSWWLEPAGAGQEVVASAGDAGVEPGLLLSVDLARLPAAATLAGLDRVVRLSLEADAPGGRLRARLDVQAALAPGEPLAAREVLSLPPVDHVLRHGSPRVRAWLDSLGWGPAEVAAGISDAFPAWEVVLPYEQAHRATSPLFRWEPHAIVGGWPPELPDPDPPGGRLVLTTVRNAEPWYQVWARLGGLVLRERIT